MCERSCRYYTHSHPGEFLPLDLPYCMCYCTVQVRVRNFMECGAFVPDSCQAYRHFSYIHRPTNPFVSQKMALGGLFPRLHISFASRVFRAANLYRGVHAGSRLSPFAATLIKPHVGIANKRLTISLNPLDATLMKNRGRGAQSLSTRNRICIPGLSALRHVSIPGLSALRHDGRSIGTKDFQAAPIYMKLGPSAQCGEGY